MIEEIQENFSKIYDQYVTKIYRFIYLKVSSQEVAEDLSSEVFMRTWETYRSESSKIENIQAYLYKVARNIIADHYRTRKVRIVSVEDNFDLLNTPKDHPSRRETDTYYITDTDILRTQMTVIAQITGKTEENVRVGIHRALQALKGKVSA